MKFFTHPITIAVFVFGALGAFLFLTRPVDAHVLAQQFVDECKDAKNKPTCYETEVPHLYPKYSIKDVFEVVRGIRVLDPEYQFCHVLAHKLGEAAVAKDPDKWFELMPQNPSDGLCSNGFVHGVIGGRFRAEVLDESTITQLLPQFEKACEPRPTWQPSSLDEAICYHGMGHLYMFITDADVPHALSLCEETTQSPTGDFRRVCTEGVFMQIFQAIEPDDTLLVEKIKPKKQNIRNYCATFTDDIFEGACLRESWPEFKDGIIDGSGVGAFCANHPNNDEETKCYQSVFSVLGRQSLAHTDQILHACAQVPEARKPMCYEYGARAILEESRLESTRAIDFCLKTPPNFVDGCIVGLIQTASFTFGTQQNQYQAFCKALPVNYQASCNP